MIPSKSASACIRKSRSSPSETDSTTLESTVDSRCGLTVASRLDICCAALRLTSANRTCSSTCFAGGAWSLSTTVAPVPLAISTACRLLLALATRPDSVTVFPLGHGNIGVREQTLEVPLEPRGVCGHLNGIQPNPPAGIPHQEARRAKLLAGDQELARRHCHRVTDREPLQRALVSEQR